MVGRDFLRCLLDGLLNLLLLDLDLRLGLGLSGLRSRNLRRLDLGFLSGFLLLFRGSARSEGQRGGDRKGDAVLHGDDAWLDQAKAMLHVEIPFDLDSAILARSEEHTSELQSLMRISYAVFCLKKKNKKTIITYTKQTSNTTKL